MKYALLVFALCLFLQGCSWMRLPDPPNYAPQPASSWQISQA